MEKENTRKRPWIIKTIGWSAGLVPLLLVMAVWSISTGSADISFVTVWQIIAAKIPGLTSLMDLSSWNNAEETIVWQIRLPRVFLAAMVGMGLAVAGVAFQGVLRNPLADPYILGVSSGAAFGAALVILLGWQQGWFGAWTLPIIAFASAMMTLLIVYRLALIRHKIEIETILLAGVVVQAFVGAALSFMLAISNERMQQIVFWLLGSLALSQWEYGWVVAPLVIAGSLIIWLYTRELNIIALGEESAYHVGVAVDRIRILLLVMASLITAAAVSVSGTIGFIGMIVPHIARLLVGSDHRVLLPVSAVLGASLLIVADTMARSLMDPRELPIGVITAFLGAPFFAYLLRKRKNKFF